MLRAQSFSFLSLLLFLRFYAYFGNTVEKASPLWRLTSTSAGHQHQTITRIPFLSRTLIFLCVLRDFAVHIPFFKMMQYMRNLPRRRLRAQSYILYFLFACKSRRTLRLRGAYDSFVAVFSIHREDAEGAELHSLFLICMYVSAYFATWRCI